MIHSTAKLPTPSIPPGVTCPHCGATEFKTRWQTFVSGVRHVRMECASCKRFVRYLKQSPQSLDYRHEPRRHDAHPPELTPPPASWEWIGLIRKSDQVWRAVALAPTLGRCWDTLLHNPGEGDRLCISTKPDPPRKESA
jgi:hypothetical protein